MIPPSNLRFSRKLTHDYIGIAIGSSRTIVIEVIAELSVASGHQNRFQTQACDAVRTATPAAIPLWRFGKRHRAFGGVVEEGSAARDAGAHHSTSNNYPVIVVSLNPFVISDIELFGVAIVDPERFDPAGQRQHAEIVGI